ncbi:flagellar biosynthetic protein FliO [Alkalimarinus sediminis]|uniref:Flagellar protein n=1 Tax=Alkalimarinus sediminis TaxID=1632866 RepID=A0A9E8HPI4_9ALTE|nr:flagellar biosynthetic protein FliO [Alkalimarinus sediminis]UZW76741.1 flagellar biosynthetic protein FliO [Alkalimarinus sediminis]
MKSCNGSQRRSDRYSVACPWPRIMLASFLLLLNHLAFAENGLQDATVEESAVEYQVTESNTQAGEQGKSETVENKRLILAPKDNKVVSSPGVNSSDWLKAILGLIAVVALIFAIAWFVKRFTGLAVSNQQQMRIISAIPVGTKERIALIEVAEKQLLVGITQHNINLLHSFEEPVVNKNDKTAVDFSSRLQAILSKGTSD